MRRRILFGGKTLREIGDMEDLRVDESMILKWILRKLDWRAWAGFIWLTLWQVLSCFEHDNKLSVSVRYGEFLDYV